MIDASTSHWKAIWKWKTITPKVKVFLWRLLHKGLPMAATMHRRIAHFSPICQRCHEENEYEIHCLFFCNSSRQVWFGSMLGLRVHDLPMDITNTVINVMNGLDEEGNRIFANTMWEIWKERNKTVMEHKIFQPQAVLQRVRVSVSVQRDENKLQMPQIQILDQERYDYKKSDWQVLVDASWATTNKAGGGFVLYKNGSMQAIGFHSFEAQDPFQAEAVALKNAITFFYQYTHLSDGEMVEFFSDCLNLVNAVNQGDVTDLPSWRAEGVILELIANVQLQQSRLIISHAKREALAQAHDLANLARRRDISYQGQPHMVLQQGVRISTSIDERFFQRVPDNPP
ncbi:Ribonuclease H-like superfamily protein [Rhynchospora pubera]|uniref:Ribonuclease H-like superfamily protein n=1 Tax=Rhynchospora pubera TaxID=906938 RepID=A0AAV8DEC8_9POAL|nr:Ribonuclease H-like superfamily protein [Rhynchospora pubera]